MYNYSDWLKDFVDGVIELYETEGGCDFTTELQYYFSREVGLGDEKALLVVQSIADQVAEDLKEVFEERGYKAYIRPYAYPYPEVRLL